MHWMRSIEASANLFDESMKRRGIEGINAVFLLDLESKLNKARLGLEELYSKQNKMSSVIRDIMSSRDIAQDEKEIKVAELVKEGEKLKRLVPELKKKVEDLEKELNDILESLPNFLGDDVPNGLDDDENKEIRRVGDIKEFGFIPKDHVELGESLRQMDFERAAKMSGSRFVVLIDKLARLERALFNFMLDMHVDAGFVEVSVPTLVLHDAMRKAGQLPKFHAESFTASDKYRLIPTSEVSLVNMVSDSLLERGSLPRRFVAFTRCYRSEAGAAGRDTRGMMRLHEFSKVELVSITTPEDSENEHQHLLSAAEAVLRSLQLPYRVVLLCSGSTGFHSVKTYDIEVWLPGQVQANDAAGKYGMYREIVSCSNCWHFQSVRLNAKYIADPGRGGGKKKYEYLHTLNCSGIAVGRALIAILENYQQSDGSIVVPEVLRKYTGFDILEPVK